MRAEEEMDRHSPLWKEVQNRPMTELIRLPVSGKGRINAIILQQAAEIHHFMANSEHHYWKFSAGPYNRNAHLHHQRMATSYYARARRAMGLES